MILVIVTQHIRCQVFVLTLTFVWSNKVWFTWEKQWDDNCGFVLLTLGLVLSFAPAGVECFPASEGWEWSRSRNPLSLTDRSTSHCWTSEDANMKREQIKLNFVSSHICCSYDVSIQSTHWPLLCAESPWRQRRWLWLALEHLHPVRHNSWHWSLQQMPQVYSEGRKHKLSEDQKRIFKMIKNFLL